MFNRSNNVNKGSSFLDGFAIDVLLYQSLLQLQQLHKEICPLLRGNSIVLRSQYVYFQGDVLRAWRSNYGANEQGLIIQTYDPIYSNEP